MFVITESLKPNPVSTIEWLRDLIRKESGTDAGRGIFTVTEILPETSVALYWGNLVNQDGAVQIKCEATSNLRKLLPNITRPFSRGHCASVESQRSQLWVDGSHHMGSNYDSHPKRNGVPWGSCLNSSHMTGVPPNCCIKFFDSPHFENIRTASKKLGNGNNKQAFIVTMRTILPDEELRWYYNCAQAYR